MDQELVEMIWNNKSTLTDLRATIDKSHALAVATRHSMSPVIAQIAQRLSQMKLKEEPVQCAIVASDEEIAQHFELLHFIDMTVLSS